MENLGTGVFNLRVDGQITAGASASPFSNDALTIRGAQDGTAIKFEAGGSHRFDLDCNGTGTDNLSFNNIDGTKLFTIYRVNEIVVNEDSSSTVDFRVESDSNAHALFLDAGTDVLTLGYPDSNGAFVDRNGTGFQVGPVGVDNLSGQMLMNQYAVTDTWMDICACHDDGATGVYFTIHAVRTGDQNRSYAATVRYAYNNAFNIMTVSSQNATVEYRVSGNVLQYRVTTAGPYAVNLAIMAAG